MTTVHLDVPEPWRPVVVAADGARAAQRALVDGWAPGRPAGSDEVLRRLVRESRGAHRAGVAFAAVLLDLLPAPDGGLLLLAGSLTLAFREVGTRDARVAAHGVLAGLRHRPGARLVGLAGDAARPAVLRREPSLTEVLWLVPGSSQLACLAVAGPAPEPAATLAEGTAGVALAVAASLRLERAPAREVSRA